MLATIDHNPATEEGTVTTAPDLANMVPDTMLVVTQDGNVADFIEGRSPSLQFNGAEVMNAKLTDLLPAEVAASYMNKVGQAAKSGAIKELKYEFSDANCLRNFESRFLPCNDCNVAVIVRDVSGQKQREAKLRMAAVQVGVSTALSQLEAGLAHHIRNPLTPIVLGAELAARNPAYGSNLQSAAEAGGRRIGCVMNALADIASLQKLPVVVDEISGAQRLMDISDLLDQRLSCDGEN
ncbi:MAG: hypothetical protein O2812_02250 [Chloroflexi bacterium]|nr:hypothetical protein [Chloroflexota bacterium]